ncbi:MAG: hypothetical protein J5654_03455 [Victivallales bacterium]|nr:hypothetical protein [Victivallales bacterium]
MQMKLMTSVIIGKNEGKIKQLKEKHVIVKKSGSVFGAAETGSDSTSNSLAG